MKEYGAQKLGRQQETASLTTKAKIIPDKVNLLMTVNQGQRPPDIQRFSHMYCDNRENR